MVHPIPTAILFDLDGTLRHSVPDGASTFRTFAREAGCEFNPDRIASADRWTHHYFADSEELKRDRVLSGGDEERFWLQYARRYLEALGTPDAELESLAEQVNLRMRTEYEPEDAVVEDVLPTLDQLRAQGIKVGVVTNRSQPVDELMETLGMGQTFDLVLTAGEAGVWKPDPRIFKMAVQALEVSLDGTLYVGDNFYSDIQGARNAGLQPILFDPRGLFPDPGCPVIISIEEVASILSDGAFRKLKA